MKLPESGTRGNTRPAHTRVQGLSDADQGGIELAELDSMSRGEVSRVKAFMSPQVDNIPHGRRPIKAPRECVFAGSTNQRASSDENRQEHFYGGTPVARVYDDIVVRQQYKCPVPASILRALDDRHNLFSRYHRQCA